MFGYITMEIAEEKKSIQRREMRTKIGPTVLYLKRQESGIDHQAIEEMPHLSILTKELG